MFNVVNDAAELAYIAGFGQRVLFGELNRRLAVILGERSSQLERDLTDSSHDVPEEARCFIERDPLLLNTDTLERYSTNGTGMIVVEY